MPSSANPSAPNPPGSAAHSNAETPNSANGTSFGGPGAATRTGPRLWAIGGGKGGIGKSVIATNLAVRIAQQGHRVVLVDGDLGGANLDTLLGCERPSKNLADFFERRVQTLAEVAFATGIENISLVAGHADMLGAANPTHGHKQKLIRHLRKLPCDLVVVDLGAGTSFNTLDLFLAADEGLVVTTPEPTALQNCFAFMKTAKLREVEQRTGVQRRDSDEGSLRHLGSESPEARSAISRNTSLVVNRAQPAEARRVANLLHDLSGRFLGGQVRLRAAIHDDPAVARSIRHQQPLCLIDPQSRAAQQIDALAKELWAPSVPAIASRSGINEEVVYRGQRFHVQTEDLGPSQGAVRTQIFLPDGSVMFTRRTPYVDAFFVRLTVAPADRMRFHHVAIVRALHAGRIDTLRKSA